MAELITIARFLRVDDAEVARSALEGSGIKAFLTDTHSVGNRPFLSPAMGGVRLQVLDFDAEKARECLSLYGLVGDGMYLETMPDVILCPKCNSASIKYSLIDRLILVLAYLTFVGWFMVWKPRRICRDCGYAWR